MLAGALGRRVRSPVLQTSANLTGGPDPRRLADVPAERSAPAPTWCWTAASCPGVPSTVVDLSSYEDDGKW